MATSTSNGTVQVTLTAQNRGAVVDEVVITCEISADLGVDMDIVELDAASIAYFDGEDDEVSSSMPAAAFNYDHDSDGAVMCGETERWRAGVLLRAELDADQDEGFHGYRCALASNSVEDECHNPGYFLQIAEFEDAPEDGISSECQDDCPSNTTFHELARVDHDGSLDIAAGDIATLTFYAVGDSMVCEARDVAGNVLLRAEARDNSFSSGTTGLSTLNMFGDFDDIQVCEAYALPM